LFFTDCTFSGFGGCGFSGFQRLPFHFIYPLIVTGYLFASLIYKYNPKNKKSKSFFCFFYYLLIVISFL